VLRLLAVLIPVALLPACGESDTGNSNGVATGGTGGAAGCMDIHVISDMLPKGALTFVPGTVAQMENETLWRDEHGLHFAWNPAIVEGNEVKGSRLVLSTFDPTTGKAIGHRLFPNFAFGGVARSPNGTVCLSGQLADGSTTSTGALLIGA
jgi:hypothetical protein